MRNIWEITTALLVVASSVVGCASPSPPAAAPSTAAATPTAGAPAPVCKRGRTIIVFRHGEKASTEKDTPLSERGRARARTLASMLGGAGVTRLVGSQYRRTQETLAPLAERLSLPIEVRASDKRAELVSELRASPEGAVVVVASHSNVVPVLVHDLTGARLRGVAGDELAEDDFSRVVVIGLPCAASREPPFFVELSSGE